MTATQATVTTDSKGKVSLTVVKGTNSTLSPAMVTKALRGAELAKIIKHATDELDGLKSDFEAFFVTHDTREATNAAGKVLAVRTHGDPRRLNQGMLKAAHPEIVAEFTHVQPWDSVSFKG